jgi:predicted TIM-barrel fold metal-dependent hydrolase
MDAPVSCHQAVGNGGSNTTEGMLLMSYAESRRIIDVDSHVIELDDFLHNAVEPRDRALIPNMSEQQELPVVEAGIARGRELFAKRQSDPEVMARFEASLMDNRKSGWNRLGAFDPKERSHTLDLFGYEQQWVLPTFSFHQIAHTKDPAVLAAGSRALNRGMAGFCAHDDRLFAVGYAPLSLGPQEAGAIIDEGLAAGCFTFMVDTNEPDPKARSFTHPDFDPIWARFQEARAPFIVHVAVNGHYESVSPSFQNNGKAPFELAGDAPSSAIGFVTIKNSAELFLSAMVLDGVFERHPGLRGISMEHGAFWVPSWLRALDFTADSLKRIAPVKTLPSEVVRERLKFSPFAGEPVGWIIENVGPELLVFASDYPHPEGTSDPIRKFEATMTDCDQKTMDAFYYGNMAGWLGLPA